MTSLEAVFLVAIGLAIGLAFACAGFLMAAGAMALLQ